MKVFTKIVLPMLFGVFLRAAGLTFGDWRFWVGMVLFAAYGAAYADLADLEAVRRVNEARDSHTRRTPSSTVIRSVAQGDA